MALLKDNGNGSMQVRKWVLIASLIFTVLVAILSFSFGTGIKSNKIEENTRRIDALEKQNTQVLNILMAIREDVGEIRGRLDAMDKTKR